MANRTEFELWTSERVIRALVDAFDLRDFDAGGTLRSPTGRRWLNGEVFEERKRALLEDAFVRAFVETGVLTLPPRAVVESGGPSTVFTPLIGLEITRWDALVGRVHALPNRASMSRTGGMAAVLRLLSISFALREAAWRALGDCPLEGKHPFERAFEAPGASALLREWFDEARRRTTEADASQVLTRTSLASACGVADGELDSWLDGRNTPRKASQERLAEGFSGELGVPANELLRALRLHIGLSRLLEELAGEVDRATLGMIVEHHATLVPRIGRALDLVKLPLRGANELFLLAMMGVGHDAPHARVLAEVATDEPNPLWKQMYADVLRPWDELFSSGIAGLAKVEGLAAALTGQGLSPEEARHFADMIDALLQIGLSDAVVESILVDCTPAERERFEHPLFEVLRVLYSLRIGDPEGAFARLERLAERFASTPELFLVLVQFALLAGSVNAADSLMSLALEKGAGSVELDLERAKIAVFQGHHTDAVALLESVVGAMGESHPSHVDALYSLAVALANDGRSVEAMTRCEAVLERSPKHADALALAARLCTTLGAVRKGGFFERRSRALGRSNSLPELWLLVDRLTRLVESNLQRREAGD